MSLKDSLLAQLSRGPRTAKQLRAATGAEGKKISKALAALQTERKVRAEKGVFFLAAAGPPPLDATLVKLGRAFGFATAADGSGDIFIPGHSLLGAMPGDEVLVALNEYPRRPGSREGEVTAVTQRRGRLTGTVERMDGRLVLLPDNAPDTPLAIRRGADAGAMVGEKVAAEITHYGNRHDEHQVDVTLRFGSADSAKLCAKAILYAAGIERAFPTAVKEEAKRVSELKITREELKTRKDLRDEAIFTIDSESTKDIDDAISVKAVLNGYLVGVHIADVSHYVRPKSELDAEAMNRGTSIYYADSVIPMLPKALSNGACSLNPGEDRLAFSCFMTLDEDGSMLDYRFYKSVIRSRVKGVYTEINAILKGAASKDLRAQYAEVAPTLPLLREVYEKLAHLRGLRGSMEIESDEAKLILDENGVCVGVEKRERGVSERIIEEFMLLANTAAAHLARRADLPFVYRVHDKPSADRVENLKRLLAAFGLEADFKDGIPTQAELGALLDKTRGTNLEVPVHTAVLRTMAKAVYAPEPKGHFGLALRDYAHFTSPIRRYPDLAIHRILSDHAAGLPAAQVRKKYKAFADEASFLSSTKEQQAQQIERDCDDCYKAEFMHSRLGEVYDGVISSVAPFGVYVALENSVEGLVHTSALSHSRLELNEGVSLTDPVTGQSWRIGQPLQVKVAGVNVSQGNVDFVLPGEG